MYAALHLCWCIAALAAGLGLYLRWRLTGEAPIGLLAGAFAVLSFPQIPSSVADVASGADGIALTSHPLVEAAVLLPASWLLLRSLRTPAVDSALCPGHAIWLCGGVASTVVVAISIGEQLGALPRPGPFVTTALNLTTGVLALVFGWAFARYARSLTRPITTRVGVVFAGLGVAALVDALAHPSSPWLALLSKYIDVVAIVLMALLSTSLLRSVLDHNGLRMLSLSLRADSAEEVVRREQERMHELRATVAGIRSASGTLSRYEHKIAAAHKQTLEQMMADELGRLERLLNSDEGRTAQGPAMLDDVIRPLVVRHREQGMTVQWRPSGVCASIRADEVAEVLNVLLTNAHRHAPGASVEIVVEAGRDNVHILVIDNGPGVPAHIVDRIFERGSRTASSTGQGLGLHIAKRLAANQDGDLTLLQAPTSGGAAFMLALCPAPPPSHVLPSQRKSSEDA